MPWSHFTNQLLPARSVAAAASRSAGGAGGNGKGGDSDDDDDDDDDDDGSGGGRGDDDRDDDGAAAVSDSFRVCAWLRTAGTCLSPKPTSSASIGRLDSGSAEVLAFPQRLSDIPLGSVVVRAVRAVRVSVRYCSE